MSNDDCNVQGSVLSSAVLYIVLGVPLYLCWMSVFIVIAAVAAAVIIGGMLQDGLYTNTNQLLLLIGYKWNRNRREEMLNELEKIYMLNSSTGVWLALTAEGVQPSKPFIISTSNESQESELKIGQFD